MSAPDQLDHSEPAPTNEDRLRTTLAWHFRCHAEEPGKSYASLGIANAELIVARMVADAKAKAWDECVDLICSPDESGTANRLRFKRANPYRVESEAPR